MVSLVLASGGPRFEKNGGNFVQAVIKEQKTKPKKKKYERNTLSQFPLNALISPAAAKTIGAWTGGN